MTNRRSFLLGAAAVLATPAIVRAESIMRVVAPKLAVPGRDFVVLEGQQIFGMPSQPYLVPSVEYEAFLDGVRQTMSKTVFYGNSFWLTENGIMRHIPNEDILPGFVDRLDETA